MKKVHKLGAVVLAAALLLTMAPTAQAESSAEIRSQINELEDEQAQIQERMDELQSQMDSNWESIEEMVAYKNNIDEQMFLLYDEIDNLDEQITYYTTLIVETQQQLDEAQAELDELNVKYKNRIRAMEEEGEISYWSVIFKSSSFTELMDRLNMVKEIAEADQRMLEKLESVAAEVAAAKESLEAEKAGLEESRQVQLEAQAGLEALRAEADRVLSELNADHQALEALHDEALDENNALVAEIAAAEKEFTAAVKAEQEERRRQEEEERRRQEEQNNANNNNNSDDDDEPTTTTPPSSSSSGWLQPCSYTYISSSYGYRSSGFHNGVDFAAPQGTPIYASRSGTVTTATALRDSNGNYRSYGNYVVINHGDGYSSLYAHMTYYVVAEGDYVTQGQLIGYVGSTGNSTGNHLHFTIFYNGSTVNPMNYL